MNLIVNEYHTPNYKDRTIYNASSSDVTLALATDLSTRGEQLTKRTAGHKYIGFELVEDIPTIYIARQLFKKLKTDNAKTLNIAGNGIYTLQEAGCSQEFINQFVYEVLSQTHYFYPIEKIYTGGQTGVDLAGAVAAVKLSIPVEVTLPKGFIQRHEDHKDQQHTQQDILDQIHYYVECLHPHTALTKEQLLLLAQKNKENSLNNSNDSSAHNLQSLHPNNIKQGVPSNRSIRSEYSNNSAPKPNMPSHYYPEDNYLPIKRVSRTFESLDDIMPPPQKPQSSSSSSSSNIIENKPKNRAFGVSRKG
jgi:predicted GIY-YIG superfamily endonuclease